MACVIAATLQFAVGPVARRKQAIENIPAGFRARETYLAHGPDAFDEVFEIAEPGKPFDVYSRARFTRIK